MAVGRDLAAVGHLDAERLEPQPVDVRFATRGDQHGVGFDLVGAVVLAQLVGDFRLALVGFNRLNRRAQSEAKPLFCKQSLEGFGHFGIHAGGDVVEEFDHLHLCAQAGVDGAELQPDDACADHDHGLGDLGQGERPSEVTTIFSSTSMPGRVEGVEPVAMIMFFVS
jgi:hypothetical protein